MSGSFKGVPIDVARSIGKEHKADRVAIFAIRDDGVYSITTYGKTRAKCDAMKRWAEEYATAIANSMRHADE